jgi:hypothetical protein
MRHCVALPLSKQRPKLKGASEGRVKLASVVPFAVPILLAVIHVVLVAATLPQTEGGFSSLEGVSALFANPWALLTFLFGPVGLLLYLVMRWLRRGGAIWEFSEQTHPADE